MKLSHSLFLILPHDSRIFIFPAKKKAPAPPPRTTPIRITAPVPTPRSSTPKIDESLPMRDGKPSVINPRDNQLIVVVRLFIISTHHTYSGSREMIDVIKWAISLSRLIQNYGRAMSGFKEPNLVLPEIQIQH